MSRRCFAFGNNVCGNLDPSNSSPILHEPVEVTEVIKCDEILWHGWSCSIGRDKHSGTLRAWGVDPIVTSPDRINVLSLPAPANRVFGFDRPLGFLSDDGYVYTFAGYKSSQKWDDLVVTGLGALYALREGKVLVMFESLEAFIADTKPTRLSHPLLEPSTATSMYAAESRVFVHTEGTASHVLEVLTDHRAVGRQTPTLQLVEDLEGLGILSIIPGSSNRLAVVADSGDGYLFSKGAKRPELLDLGEATVRMLGLGSEFEAVVTEDSLWVRGENGFGQLGIPGKADEFARHTFGEAKRIVQIVSARWSTLLMIDG